MSILRHIEEQERLSLLKPDGTVAFYEPDYAGLVEYLQDKVLSYAIPQSNPPKGVPARQLRHFPARPIPPEMPLMAVGELPPEMAETGRPESTDVDFPVRSVKIGMLVYHPSLKRADEHLEYEDGRMQAHRLTRAVWSNWLEGFRADRAFRGQFARIAMTIEASDVDRVGEGYYQDRRKNTVLWLRATEIAFHL